MLMLLDNITSIYKKKKKKDKPVDKTDTTEMSLI